MAGLLKKKTLVTLSATFFFLFCFVLLIFFILVDLGLLFLCNSKDMKMKRNGLDFKFHVLFRDDFGPPSDFLCN